MDQVSNRLLLNIHTQAPQFDLVDIFDRKVRLTDYQGSKVFLAFFRHAGCPFCNLRVHTLLKKHEELTSIGLKMIFFFESEAKVLLNSDFHKGVSPIPLISDPQKIWYNKYGIESSALKSGRSHITSFIQTVMKAKYAKLPVHWMTGNESINTIPAEFLIDEKGIAKQVHYAKSLTDRMSLEVIMNFAKSNI